MLASEYGWTEDDCLDKPYYKIKELIYCVKVRQYAEALKQLKTTNLATNGSQDQVNQFVKLVKPDIPDTRDKRISKKGQPAGKPVAPMDLSSLEF